VLGTSLLERASRKLATMILFSAGCQPTDITSAD
jgi:hypothetical protein